MPGGQGLPLCFGLPIPNACTPARAARACLLANAPLPGLLRPVPGPRHSGGLEKRSGRVAPRF
eukprot:11212089-Lingulodinium_polyedra.AAC.1